MEKIQEIIDDLKAASRSLDLASEKAKLAGRGDIYQQIESIWSDTDVLFQKLTKEVARGS